MTTIAQRPKTRHAVLTQEGLVTPGQASYTPVDSYPTDIEALMSIALAQRCTHLWIPPACNLAFTGEQIRALLDTTRWDVGENGRFISIQKQGKWKGHVASITGRALTPRPTMNTRLLFVQQGNWPLDAATPAQLLQVSDTIETRLGVAMAGSPTSVGLRYLEKMNTRYYGHYFEKSEDVDWDALKTSHVPAFAWFPALGMDTQYSGYVHCFDRNGSHPFAASQENMGVGTPYLQEGGDFNKKVPGLWEVEISGGEHVSPDLPPLFPKGRHWLATPLLRVATLPKVGYTVKVIQAFLWPEGKPIFERWAKELWAFREQYPDGSMERQAGKSIMNNTVGSTRVGEEMDKTMRPDWYATILASERAVVWYKAWKLAQDCNVYPCGAYADALYYRSLSADPAKAVPGLLDHAHSLGGYKHVWTLPIDADARAVLTAPLPANRRIQELKKLVARGQEGLH